MNRGKLRKELSNILLWHRTKTLTIKTYNVGKLVIGNSNSKISVIVIDTIRMLSLFTYIIYLQSLLNIALPTVTM